MALQKYEGQKCTSGVIFVAKPSDFLKSIKGKAYLFEPFADQIEFGVGFFRDPTVHRYVDGRNAFYVVDNWRRVCGILRLESPENYSLTDRAEFLHLDYLLHGSHGRTFVAFVGRNDDLNVLTANDLQFRWQKLSWSLVDRSTFLSLLSDAGLDDGEAKKLIAVLFAISDLRFGSLVLIAKDQKSLPSRAGSIAASRASAALKDLIVGKKLSALVTTNTAIGVLTSDGLTTFDARGVCINAGEIIDLRAIESRAITGGGRTQAARAASFFGLSIKVSEDGPILIFRDGRELMHYTL